MNLLNLKEDQDEAKFEKLFQFYREGINKEPAANYKKNDIDFLRDASVPYKGPGLADSQETNSEYESVNANDGDANTEV